ncbi:MAG: ParB N-terminal domain-containing protein [Candidatus Andersenbacteria bacterium]|nr:ParB N-terminal domain-containing protein [Candidatus Andersenbacteria bacterium]
MQHNSFVVKEVPLERVEQDRNQPRRSLGKPGEERRLSDSIKRFGIQQLLSVSEMETDRYVLLDGHRRFVCARKLKLPTVPCRVYPALKLGEFEFLRFEIQNNRKSWSPLERAESINRIKKGYRFTSNREVADLIHLSESTISTSLQLRDLNIKYLELMRDYGLKGAFQEGFVRLDKKIVKVGEMEYDDIVRALFDKIRRNVIRNAKDFRRLGRVFMRATTHQKELLEFFRLPDMTVEQLMRKTDHSRLLYFAEELKDELVLKLKNGLMPSAKEKQFLSELRELFAKVVRVGAR